MNFDLQENINLRQYNTFGIDINARFLYRLKDPGEIALLEEWTAYESISKLILGGGSNILFTTDYDGLVIKNELLGFSVVDENEDEVLIKVMGGENWHSFVLTCIDRNWGGIENLSLIPGCTGAAPIQNIGAYGVEIKDVFHSVEFYNMPEKQYYTFHIDECQFGYRDSIFKNELRNKIIVLALTLKLSKKPKINISYGAIRQTLDEMKLEEIDIKAVSDAVIKIRSSKLPDPAIVGNAGSFFKNPVISTEKLQDLKEIHPLIPSYSISEDTVKIPAAWLIEKAGWKGYRSNDAGTYPQQPLVLVNYNNASGKEIFALSEKIRKDIQSKFGIELSREVNVL